MRLILLYLLCLLLTACSPSAPGPTVDDPRAYLLEALRTRDLKSWVTPYRDPDPAFANTVLDAALKSWPEWTGKPMDQKVLDRFLKTRLLSRFGAAHLRTPEARAKVRAQAEARVQHPPMAIVYDDEFPVAALDLWHLPGPWKKSGRAQTWQMQASPLSRAEIGRTFSLLTKKYPEAQLYEVRYVTQDGATKLVYDTPHESLWRGEQRVSIALPALLTGNAPLEFSRPPRIDNRVPMHLPFYNSKDSPL